MYSISTTRVFYRTRCAAVDDDTKDADVLVFVNPSQTPIPVPSEVAYEANRAYRAYQLHRGGKNWHQVAEEEGYATAGAARYEVRQWLTEAQALVSDFSRREMLSFTLDQINQLQQAVWEKALEGHLPSFDRALSTVMARAKLLKLDETIDGDEEQGGPRTVVVQVDGYADTLQRVIAGE